VKKTSRRGFLGGSVGLSLGVAVANDAGEWAPLAGTSPSPAGVSSELPGFPGTSYSTRHDTAGDDGISGRSDGGWH